MVEGVAGAVAYESMVWGLPARQPHKCILGEEDMAQGVPESAAGLVYEGCWGESQ